MFRVIGHDENDIHPFFESVVPLFAKRFSKATAGTQIDTRRSIIVSVNKINFVPQSIQDCNLPVTRCRGNGILRNCRVGSIGLSGGAYGRREQNENEKQKRLEVLAHSEPPLWTALILRNTPLGGESEQAFFAFFKLGAASTRPIVQVELRCERLMIVIGENGRTGFCSILFTLPYKFFHF